MGNKDPQNQFTSATAPRGAPKGNKNAAKYGRWKRALDTALEEYEDAERGIQKGSALAAMAKECVKDAFSSDPKVSVPARAEIANRLDGKPKEHLTIEGEFSHRLAEELTDDELAGIIRAAAASAAGAGGDGAATPPSGPQDPSAVH